MQKTNNPHPDSWMVLVQLLREIAEQKGITQDAIAERTGIMRTNVSRIFNMRYRPRIDIFLKISEAIGVTLFLEDKEGKSDFNKAMEKAMYQLGRRPGKIPEN